MIVTESREIETSPIHELPYSPKFLRSTLVRVRTGLYHGEEFTVTHVRFNRTYQMYEYFQPTFLSHLYQPECNLEKITR